VASFIQTSVLILAHYGSFLILFGYKYMFVIAGQIKNE